MAKPILASHFDDVEQQHNAATLGMWTFLATEILFFGALFVAYIVYRVLHPLAFVEGSRHLYLAIGATNAAILIVSGLTMALAVHACTVDSRRGLVGWLLATIALGLLFIGLKGFEYALDYREALIPAINFHYTGPADARDVEMFMVLYFAMTGLHTIHIISGIIVLAVIAVLAWLGRYSSLSYTAVAMTGLYWSFVDIVWIFLFPLLYLSPRS